MKKVVIIIKGKNNLNEYSLKKFKYNIYQVWLIVLLFLLLNGKSVRSQDTIKQSYAPSITSKTRFYKTKVFKATVLPGALIAYGALSIHGHGFPSSFYVFQEVNEDWKIHRTHIDDYLQYAPYVGLLGLNLLKIKSQDDFINTGILTVKSVALNMLMVFTVKKITHITRPDSINPARNNSFPSGHTANAFAAATLIHKEFGRTNITYSIAAYTVASTVGLFRILNNRHWFSDVVAGAGFGILSVNLVYLTHHYRWGKKPGLVIVPSYNNGMMGMYFSQKF